MKSASGLRGIGNARRENARRCWSRRAPGAENPPVAVGASEGNQRSSTAKNTTRGSRNQKERGQPCPRVSCEPIATRGQGCPRSGRIFAGRDAVGRLAVHRQQRT